MSTFAGSLERKLMETQKCSQKVKLLMTVKIGMVTW